MRMKSGSWLATSAFVALAVLMSMVPGILRAETTQNPGAAPGIMPASYDELLHRYRDFVALAGEGDAEEPGFIGVWEAVVGREPEDALSLVGYRIMDISGDQVPELLIGAATKSGDEWEVDGVIYAVFTLLDGKPNLTFEGWARNRYRYLGEGRFLNQGSNGAIYSIFGTYVISSDGQSLQNEEYYFTYEKDEDCWEIGLYRNTTGQWDPAVSEELQMTERQFWQVEERLEQQVVSLQFIPFAD